MLPPTFQSMSAIREWETLMRQIGAIAESAVDATARPERLWQVNQLEAVIEATDHGAIVGDSGYTREAALAARRFVQAFLAWSQTEIEVDQLPDGTPILMSPMAIISLRATA